MKKILMTLAAVLCCAMTTTVFTACGSDEESNPPVLPQIVAYEVSYSLDFPQSVTEDNVTYGNIYLLCKTIEVSYVDENGQEQKEVVTNGKWAKTITYKKSLEGYLKLHVTQPENIDAENLPYEKYTNKITIMPSAKLEGITAIYNNGTREKATVNNIERKESHYASYLRKDKLEQYFEKAFKEDQSLFTLKLKL